ncbi:MAG TPA: hypothetical protein VHB21_05350 [Minicystis sp.]|nr:hypothetical protein [Minicystis sp.]
MRGAWLTAATIAVVSLSACQWLVPIDDKFDPGGGGAASSSGRGGAGGSAPAGSGGTSQTTTSATSGGDGGHEVPGCLVVCKGQCANTLEDANNCGLCGHVCNDAPCDGGICGRSLFRGHGSEAPSATRPGGELFTWGADAELQAGNGMLASYVFSPVHATRFSSQVRYPASTGGATCALLATGLVQCLGDNGRAEIGNGDLGGPDACNDPGNKGCVGTPFELPLADIAEVTGAGNWKGGDHVCARTTSGAVVCWGQWGADQGVWTSPTTINLVGAVQLAAGAGFTCALRSDQTVWCWGGNWGKSFQEGAPDDLTPVQVPGLSGVTLIGGGVMHACAKAPDGIYCWGSNRSGQLGVGSSATFVAAPSRVVETPGLTDADVLQIEGGTDTTCALVASGDVYCWGLNGGDGMCADGQTDGAECPQGGTGCILAPRKSLVTHAVEIAYGDYFGLARLADGSIVSWGSNVSGALGIGDATVSDTTPTPASVAFP